MAEYPPETFDPVFTAPQQPTIVGGHAVNLWASYYAQRDPRLAAFQPFLSKDGDIYTSDKELARAIAAAAGWTFIDNPEFRSISLGNIEMKQGDEYLRVDVLRSVYGLSNDDLTYTADLTFTAGQTYRVPLPHILLKAKLANLGALSQGDRQDARHVRYMIICTRHSLLDLANEAARKSITERETVHTFSAVRKLISQPKNQELDRLHQLNIEASIPEFGELPQFPSDSSIENFYRRARKVRPES